MHNVHFIDLVSQFGVAGFGIIAIMLVARKNKWGFVFGILSQPFWFVTSYVNGQWGVFALSVVYLGSWSYGVYEWFFKEKLLQRIAQELHEIENNPRYQNHLAGPITERRARTLRWLLQILSPN